jgi:hypothetical protein
MVIQSYFCICYKNEKENELKNKNFCSSQIILPEGGATNAPLFCKAAKEGKLNILGLRS